MTEPIDTDVELVTYEPLEGETWWPYGRGTAKLAYRLNKNPREEWIALFKQLIAERSAGANQIFISSQIQVETRGRAAITCVVNDGLKDRVLTAINEARSATNERAQKLNDEAEAKRKAHAEQTTSSHESARLIAESMRGRK